MIQKQESAEEKEKKLKELAVVIEKKSKEIAER